MERLRIEHVARHNVGPDEVWEVCCDPLHLAHREGTNRYRMYGQTESGRYLFVVLERTAGAKYKPITARDMSEAEKNGYRRLRKK
jgi:uncharacterized protein